MTDLQALASLVTDDCNVINAAEQRILSTLRDLRDQGCTILSGIADADLEVSVFPAGADTDEPEDRLLFITMPSYYADELAELEA